MSLQPEKLYLSNVPTGGHLQPSLDSTRLRDLLDAASARTEEKFLLLGGRLADFHRRSREVARQAESVSGLFLGEEATQAVGGLQELVQGLGRHRSEMEAMTEFDRHALTEVDRLLEKLHEPLSGFRKIIKTLQSLGIATRIESSQTGRQDTGFLVFADDLKELSLLIDSRSAQVLGQLRELREHCRNAWEKIAGVQTGQNEKSRDMLRQAESVLAQMALRTREASLGMESVSSRAAGFAGKIGEVVASIQFQDIVRQKVMHVQEALADAEAAGLDGADAAQIFSLQGAQLQHARTEMEIAIGKVVESLRSLATQISATAEQTRRVAGTAGAADVTIFREFEKAIGGISLLLQEGEAICRESMAAVATVAAAVDDMAGMLEEIEFLGEKMKVVALNAGIRAAHVGRQGAALGVIAESIQQMSAEALVLTRELASGFREIMTCARSLGESEKSAIATPEALLRSATELLRHLQGINDLQVTRLHELDTAAADLAAELLQVAIATDLQETFSRDIEEVIACLQTAAPSTATGKGKDSALVQELMSRYTMHSEREIHRQQSGGERKVIPLPPRSSKVHDLGDNVELF